MDLKKIVPWNWFKKEEEWSSQTVPVKHKGQRQPPRQFYSSLAQMHQEMNQMFDNFFKGFGSLPARSPGGSSLWDEGFFPGPLTEGLLKPTIDIGATDKEYAISVEVPGVDQKDVKIEIANNTLTIKGEKKQEKEEKEENYYRMERSFGSFQRVLALPEDADHDGVKATFKNGVLTLKLPRKALPHSAVKQIEIK